MKTKVLDYIDFEKVNSLLEGFNKSTGFVTAILDLKGNVLSKSGWRQICTEFHRINPETGKKCRISDTVLANKMAEGEKYHFYKCLNGLIDVAVPVIINGEHIANLFSGQFFFEKPDISIFKKQAAEYGFDEKKYIEAVEAVPVVSKERVKSAMDFLLNMTQLISETTYQKLEQSGLNKTLKESEERFRRMFEDNMAYMLLVDPATLRIIDANTAAESFYGWNREQLREMTIGQINTLPPAKIRKEMELARSRQRSYFKFMHHKANGSVCNVEIYSSKVEIDGKEYLHSIIHDITEQVKAEQNLARLLESEKAALAEANKVREQLSQILERISDGFGSLDRDWHYTFINEKLAQNVGRKREDLLGHNIWSEFPEAIGTPVHKAYLRAMEEQVVIELEHYYTPFGRWFQHRFYPSLDGISVFSKDITESKQSEEKLRESNSLIRIAAEKAKLGGWNVDLKESRSYWSDVVAAIHEMPPGYAPLVKDGINFYAPEWRDRITKFFTDCAGNGVPYDEEMEIITSTGKRVWVRTIGEAVRDENGNIYKVQGAFQDISEKKIIEAKSREKDLQVRKLSANVPDLIFQITRKPDGSYYVPVASEGIINIFGCTPEDVADDFAPIGKVIYPEDAERVIADIEYSANHLTQFTCEFRVLIPGRPVQWILSHSTPEKLPDGSVTWYGFNTNITPIKEVEDALRESEGKFRKIYEDGPYGMILVNSEYKFIIANRTFCEITGYTEYELRSLTFNDITYPDDLNKGIESVKKLIKGEIPVVRLEKRYVKKNGQVIWGSITVAANFDKNGNFLYNLAIVEDITRRKLSDEEIRSLNERLQMLVKAIQELSVSTSMENIMKTVRSYARKLVNADGSTFILRDGDYCFYADEDTISPLWKGQRFSLTNCISGWAMLNKQFVKIDDIYSDERIPIENYKSTFVKSLAIAPIRLSDPLGAIGAYWGGSYSPSEMEIQLLKTLADAAAKAVENIQLIDGLEKRIIERTSQLQSVNEELEAFSYSVSHDLRAPLRHINGFAEILTRQYSDELSDDARKHLNTINASAQKMGILIDDLLSFSRTGRAELKRSSLSMEQVVKDALNQIAPAIKDRKIDWKISPLPEVNGDYNLLRLVWINLLDNAVKYTAPKKIAKINIDYKIDKNMFVFHISDNGVGFDMNYSQKLFGVFQRLHSSTQFEGTGIGLANVRRIIVRHGGHTWAEAKPGKGATFYFSLPKTMADKL